MEITIYRTASIPVKGRVLSLLAEFERYIREYEEF
jgi:hypothetical protein